jgi:hypothetical protein
MLAVVHRLSSNTILLFHAMYHADFWGIFWTSLATFDHKRALKVNEFTDNHINITRHPIVHCPLSMLIYNEYRTLNLGESRQAHAFRDARAADEPCRGHNYHWRRRRRRVGLMGVGSRHLVAPRVSIVADIGRWYLVVVIVLVVTGRRRWGIEG